jgi:hypothetical protein
MSNDNNNLNNKETIKDAFIIFLFPPMNIEESKNYVRFIGWNFISGLGGETKIDIPYLLVEVGMATLVYIFFLISQKK